MRRAVAAACVACACAACESATPPVAPASPAPPANASPPAPPVAAAPPRIDAGLPPAQAQAAPCVSPRDYLPLVTARDKAFDICYRVARDAASTAFDHACWQFSLVDHSWTFMDRHPEPPQPPTASPASHVARGDGAYVADWDSDAVRVSDRAGKLVHTFKSWLTGMPSKDTVASIQDVRFVDDTLAIYVSHTPVSDEIRLYEPRSGRQLGAIKPENGVGEVAPTPLGNHLYAFFEFPALQLLVVDVATGRLALRAKLDPDPESAQDPSLVTRLPDGTLAIVDANQVDLVDKRGADTHYRAPACPAGSGD